MHSNENIIGLAPFNKYDISNGLIVYITFFVHSQITRK